MAKQNNKKKQKKKNKKINKTKKKKIKYKYTLLCATVMGLGQLIHLKDPNCLVLFTLICPSSPTLEGEQTIFRM